MRDDISKGRKLVELLAEYLPTTYTWTSESASWMQIWMEKYRSLQCKPLGQSLSLQFSGWIKPAGGIR